jgi:L-malate glycosyltransferase
MRSNGVSRRLAILCHSGAGGSGVMATELAVLLAELGHQVHLVGERKPFRLGSTNVSVDPDGPEYQDLGEDPPPKSFWGQLLRLAQGGFRRHVPRIAPAAPAKGSLHFHEILSHQYPLFEGAPYLTLKAANTIASLIERYQIEVVNAHYAIPHATSAILARDAGLPVRVVTTLHGTDITSVGIDPAYRFTTQHALRCSDAVTAVSSSLMEGVRRDLGVDRHIHRIPNWVDTERFSPQKDPTERLKYAQPEELLLAHVSNFRPVKNSPKVIDVFAEVCSKVPARLFLIGDGPDKAECIARAVELGVSGRVLSLPPMVEIERILRIADVLVLPSLSEAMPLVVLEAMSTGVLCVCSNVGGIPEVVTHGETGFMFDPMDTQGMAGIILEAFRDEALRKKCCLQAKEFVATEHNPEQIVRMYLDVFENVLQSPVATP